MAVYKSEWDNLYYKHWKKRIPEYKGEVYIQQCIEKICYERKKGIVLRRRNYLGIIGCFFFLALTIMVNKLGGDGYSIVSGVISIITCLSFSLEGITDIDYKLKYEVLGQLVISNLRIYQIRDHAKKAGISDDTLLDCLWGWMKLRGGESQYFDAMKSDTNDEEAMWKLIQREYSYAMQSER